MNSSVLNERKVTRIIAGIVRSVAHGPVTIALIAENVPGFSSPDKAHKSWSWSVADKTVWDRMSAEGCEALRRAIMDGHVAIAPASLLQYLLYAGTYRVPEFPLKLAPQRAANFQIGRILTVFPETWTEILARESERTGIPAGPIQRHRE